MHTRLTHTLVCHQSYGWQTALAPPFEEKGIVVVWETVPFPPYHISTKSLSCLVMTFYCNQMLTELPSVVVCLLTEVCCRSSSILKRGHFIQCYEVCICWSSEGFWLLMCACLHQCVCVNIEDNGYYLSSVFFLHEICCEIWGLVFLVVTLCYWVIGAQHVKGT